MSEESFETTDIGLACYLRYENMEIIGLKDFPTDFRRKVFCFSDLEKCQELKSDYYNDRIFVSPIGLLSIMKILKSMIYNS